MINRRYHITNFLKSYSTFLAGFEKVLLLTLFLIFIDHTSSAQSDNYWSWNFNTQSMLLAGSVVGGSAGPSAIYYNPALIDHENIPSLSLSASITSLQFLKIENIAGEDINAKKILFKIQPKFISYVLPTKNDRLGVEMAILSPITEDIEYTIQHIDTIDIIDRTAGLETYSGYLNYLRQYDDTWIGGGFSYKFSDRFYGGVSSFLSVKVLKYKTRQTAQAYQEGDSVLVDGNTQAKYISQNIFEEDFKYWYLSFIFKAGIQYKSPNNRFNLGLNITFPDIPLFGEADIRKKFTRSNVYYDAENAFTSNENTLGVEEDLRNIRVKNPWSVAVGVLYSTENREAFISLSVEYFHRIDTYALVNSSMQANWLPGNISKIITNNEFMSYNYEAGSVTNIALGFKKYMSPKLIFLGGVRTDFTAADEENVRYVSNSFIINKINMNKYHITTGVIVKFNSFSVVSGLQYSLGRNKDMAQAVNYSEPVEYNPVTDQALMGVRQNTAQASLNEFSVFVGMSVDFNK